MTIDVSGYTFAVIAVGVSFIAARSSYYLLKFMAGVCWWIVAIFWLANAPAGIAKGSPEDTAIVVMLFFVGIAFMFMPLWVTKTVNGREEGGFNVRIPRVFGGQSEEEESVAKMRGARTSAGRRADYAERMNNAMGRGRR